MGTNVIITYSSQLAYLLLALAFLAPCSQNARRLAIAGCAVAIFYCIQAPADPLWVPIAWFGIISFINLVQMIVTFVNVQKVPDAKEKLDPLEEFLQKHIFSSFSVLEIQSIVTLCIEGNVQKEEFLCRKNGAVTDMFCILQGNASVLRDGTKIGELGPGRLVAFSRFLGEETANTDVIANTDMKVIGWSVDKVEKWVGADPRRLAIFQSAIGRQLVEQILTEVKLNTQSSKKWSGT